VNLPVEFLSLRVLDSTEALEEAISWPTWSSIESYFFITRYVFGEEPFVNTWIETISNGLPLILFLAFRSVTEGVFF
jgi:hypothetical protein